jgi:hypothetical protein
MKMNASQGSFLRVHCQIWLAWLVASTGGWKAIDELVILPA